MARHVGVTPVAATRLYTIADPGARPSSLARWVALCPIVHNALESYKHLTGYHPAHKPAA